MAKRVKLKISTRLLKKRGRKNFTGAPRQSRNTKAEGQSTPDYKNVSLLKTFMTERGKILPSRISGSDASFQREITKQIKIARMMALLPFTAVN